jgi:hypothetical protein
VVPTQRREKRKRRKSKEKPINQNPKENRKIIPNTNL